MPEREWDNESNEPEDTPLWIHSNSDHTTIRINPFEAGAALGTVSASGATVDFRPVMADTSALTLDEPAHELIGINFDLRDNSWGFTFKYMLVWIFAPILMIISKMFRKKIQIRSGRNNE